MRTNVTPVSGRSAGLCSKIRRTCQAGTLLELGLGEVRTLIAEQDPAHAAVLIVIAGHTAPSSQRPIGIGVPSVKGGADGISDPAITSHRVWVARRRNIGVGVMWGSRAGMVLGTSAGTRLALGGCLLWTRKVQLRGEVRVRGSANTPVRRLVKLVRQQQQKTRIKWRCWGSATGNWHSWSGNLPVLLAPQPCCLGDIRTSRYRSLAQGKRALFR